MWETNAIKKNMWFSQGEGVCQRTYIHIVKIVLKP
jgi:hypothetical protein